MLRFKIPDTGIKIDFSIHIDEDSMLDYPIPKADPSALVEKCHLSRHQEKPEGGAISIEIVHETGDRIRIICH